MTAADFIPILEAALQAHGEPFARGDVLAFVASAWPWIAEDPDPQQWAREFITATSPTVLA